MTSSEKFDYILKLKSTSTRFFKEAALADNFKKAATLYQVIIDTIRFTGQNPNEDDLNEEKAKTELKVIRVTAYTNLMLCYHKM